MWHDRIDGSRVDGALVNGDGRTATRRLRRKLQSFRKDEGGSLIIFALFMFVMMIMITGLAIDIMRHENTRTKLQNTLDRAVLAAADLDQMLDPEAVVVDYFTKANMEQFLVDVNVENSLNSRMVEATTLANVNTFFMMTNPDDPPADADPVRRRMAYWMKRMGARSLPAVANGRAEEKYYDIEVSLVLDVSGSMNSSSRIQNLKVAAREFIDTIVTRDGEDAGVTTVSIVPYNATVNLGPRLAQEYTLTNTHGYSWCPRLPTSTFSSAAISTATPLELVSHFEYGDRSSAPINVPWCPTETYRDNRIVVHSSDIPDLQAAITGLDAYGNTAIDLGMKWGVALIDPSFRPIMENLMDDGLVDSSATGRPVDYTDGDGLKVIVLMSDGANTQEYDLREPFKSGMSDIWVRREYAGQPLIQLISSSKRSRWSIRYNDGGTPNDHTDDRFMRYNVSSWQRQLTHPYGYDAYDDDVVTADNSSDDLVTRISWQDFFAIWEERYVNYAVLREPYDNGYISYNYYRSPDYARETIVNSSQADARLSTICGVARSSQVLVFTIAFEAPTAGQTALLDCASSPSHYFDVEGTDIADAFDAIANEITRLKLTQ